MIIFSWCSKIVLTMTLAVTFVYNMIVWRLEKVLAVIPEKGGRLLPIIDYKMMLRLKGVPFPGPADIGLSMREIAITIDTISKIVRTTI